MDFIGQINPPSSKGHRFVLVATDYFTKWTEAVPLKNMTHREVIVFIAEHIIHRFGIPQTLMMDQGSLFIYLIRLDCSIHLHTMLRPSLVIRF